MFWEIFEKVYWKIWVKRVIKECQKFIEPKSTLLDIGCGLGFIAKRLKEGLDLKVLGVDIEDRRKVDIPFLLADGASLPLKDKSFDFVLIAFVLHHVREPELILKEAKRVARKKIFVYEDIKEGFWGSLICFLHALTYFLFIKPNFILNFKSEKEWKETFKKLNLELIFCQQTFSFPVKRIFFVLKP